MTEDKEYDDYGSMYDCDDDSQDELPPFDEDDEVDIIPVRFSSENGRTIGRVVADYRHPPRTKIVFPARTWVGPMPVHGEQLKVLVVHETKQEDSGRGVLFVERIIPPARWLGGQYAQCSSCTLWEVPAFDTRIVRREGPIVVERFSLRDLSTCQKCGTLHRIHSV